MARARPGTLGIVELVAAADDTPLRRTLQEDERLVRDSAAKMQTSLSQTTVGTTAAIGGMSATAVSGTQAFSLLGAQMSAVGGAAGQALGPLTAFGGALAGIGKAAFGLPGLLLGVSAALTFLIGKLIEKRRATREAREEFEQFIKSITEGQRKLEQTTAGAEFRLLKTRAETEGDPIALRRLAGTQAIAESQARARELREEAGQLRSQIADETLPGPQRRQIQLRFNELMRQARLEGSIQLAQQQKTLSDIAKLRTDARKKELDAEKKLAEDIAAARQKAETKAAETFAATPFGRIGLAIRDIIQESFQQQRLEAAFQQIEALAPAFLDPFIKIIRAKLGAPALEEAPAARLPRIFGVRATGFPDLAALSGAGGQAPSELVQLARARTKHLKNMDKALARIDRRRTGLNNG